MTSRAHPPVRLVLLLAIAATLLVPANAPAAEPPRAAPPASPAAVAACGERAAEGAKTADTERVVSGIGTLGGCIADASGIAHLFVEWETADDRARGRICVDPPVRASSWRCAWDTRGLEPGSYRVSLVAIDAAGNRGSFEQAYRVEAPTEPAPAPAEPGPPGEQPEPVDPANITPADPAQPTEPAQPAEPAEPIDRTGDPVVTPPVSLPLAEVIEARLEDCARLELAPGVVADRALTLAVLDCMTPAFRAAGSSALTLDEIPVPPAIRIAFPDAATLATADELLPNTLAGVELQLVLETPDSVDALDAPTAAAP